MKTARSEDQATYNAQSDDWIISEALRILDARCRKGEIMDNPSKVRQMFTLRHAGLEREQFDVLFLDSQHRTIEVETMFTGTTTQTSVYPREVARRALQLNASAVILAHNHPSGSTQPSRADEILTKTLKEALSLLDVRVLDHIITAGGSSRSMAEMGLA